MPPAAATRRTPTPPGSGTRRGTWWRLAVAGAMEAANLGAWLARRPPETSTRRCPCWATCRRSSRRSRTGRRPPGAVRDRFPDGGESLGIPTWHYGHEPPNLFATAIAKYFHNAAREAILLRVCDAGIVFLPGPPAPCRRCSRTPARTTTPTRPRPDGAGRRELLDRGAAGAGRCRRWPGGGRWSRGCTSWTPSRRPPLSWASGRPPGSRTTADAAAYASLWRWKQISSSSLAPSSTAPLAA